MSYSYDSYYSSNPMEEFLDSFFNGGGAAITGVVLTILMVSLAIGLVVSALVYIFSAFPLYKLAQKLNRPYAWLAWIPICSRYFRTYVLADLADNKELVIIPEKIVIKDRKMSFWIYVGISVLGGMLVGLVSSVLSLIPVIGPILCIPVALLPAICLAFMDYAYLRDTLDLFKEDKQSNKTTSIVVTVLDYFISAGIAKIIVLFTLLKRDPIPQNVVNCNATPVYETPSYAQPTYQAPVTEAQVVDTTPTYTDNNQ